MSVCGDVLSSLPFRPQTTDSCNVSHFVMSLPIRACCMLRARVLFLRHSKWARFLAHRENTFVKTAIKQVSGLELIQTVSLDMNP